MTPKQKPRAVRLTNANSDEVGGRDGPRGYVTVTNRDLARYYSLLKTNTPRLNGRELTILLAAYSAHPTRDHTRLHLTLYVDAEPSEAALKLGRKIRALSEVEQLALLDGCERYARSSEAHPVRRLNEAGLA